MIRLRREGKAFILGEYAVLFGYPALLCRVGAGLDFTLREGSKRGLFVHSSALPKPLFLTFERAKERPQESFFAAALALYGRKFRKRPALSLRIDGDLAPEYGLGSSAALAVGLVESLWRFEGEKLSPTQLYRKASSVVRTLQPQNSCADVACSVFKKSIRFQKGSFCSLPLPFSFSLYYSSVTSPTPQTVRSIQQKIARLPSLLQFLGALTSLGEQALRSAHVELMAKCMVLYHLSLLPLGWSTPELNAQYTFLLKKCRGAKLSGAGRGDCFIALGSAPLRNPKKLPFALS